MNIIVTTAQLQGVKKAIEGIKNAQSVSEIDIMYNPNMEGTLFLRYKSNYVTEDGAVAVEINYICVDAKGESKNCLEAYKDNLYAIIRDCISINLSSPLVKVI